MHRCIVDDVSYNIDSRLCAMILWLIDHAGELPEIGNLQLNFKGTSIVPQVLEAFEPIKITA